MKSPTTPQFSSVKEAVKNTFTGKRRATCSIVPVDDSRPQLRKEFTTIVPLRDITEAEEVDISQYTPEDLERLRLEDPFLYYSIPENKRRLYDSDSSHKSSPARNSALSSSFRRSSCPSILLNNEQSGSGSQERRGSVTRTRRLSVEPHPSLVMKNIIQEMMMDGELEDDDLDDSDIDEEDEKLIQALANGTFDEAHAQNYYL